MSDPIAEQVSGLPLGQKEDKPELAIERRHREMMQALELTIPNATYESKRELVELLNGIANHRAEQISDLYVKMNTINMNLTGTHKCVGDLLVEEERFHNEWRETQARLEKHNTRLSSWHLITNILRLLVNSGILVVLVLYLLDMG